MATDVVLVLSACLIAEIGEYSTVNHLIAPEFYYTENKSLEVPSVSRLEAGLRWGVLG